MSSAPGSSSVGPVRVKAEDVHAILSRHMLADGLPIVFDIDRSRGCHLFDSKSGESYLDLFSFFASQPIGFNHPRMSDPDFRARLMRAALSKPTNSDVYTSAMASFVDTFARTVIPESHRDRLFFVEGGALAVENALKAAFDWKYRKNQAKGGPTTENLEVLHFEKAFHGRSGYTLSLTNTADPRKFQYFPRFDWPRVEVPALTFPPSEATDVDEARSLAQIRQAFAERKDRIATIMVETIQGEGGDNHLSRKFLESLRAIADEEEALLIFDEVQCGMGLTGTWWAWQGVGVEPDIFAFGKKAQVCGIASNARIAEVPHNVFEESSRINSTWGGNLTDMVRCEHYIRIIEEEKLLENVTRVGAQVVNDLEGLANETGKISNVRGRGLMIAFDLSDGAARDAVQKRLFEGKVMMLPCGDVSLRFRPVLDMSSADAEKAVAAIRAAL